MQWQREQVLALAPDSASVKAAQQLTTVGKWPTLGAVDGVALWGECQGSGKTPYKTAIDLSDVAFKCSCPSRKFPCKHGLALFLLFVESDAPFATQRTQPDWVASWLAGRAKRNASQIAESPPSPAASVTAGEGDDSQIANPPTESAKAQVRRSAERAQKVAAGIAELQTWLQDLVRSGFVEAQTRPYSYWQQMSARLIDAQAPGLAGQVEALSTLINSGEGWADRLTAAVGKLFLLLEAYQRIEGLPMPLQQDVRTLIGWHQSREEVLAGQGVTEVWFVLSQTLEEEGTLLSQRVWLRGVQSGRYALILNFAHPSNRQTLDTFWRAGTVVDATIVYYTSAVPLRAVATAVTVQAARPAATAQYSTLLTHLPGNTVTDALHGYQTQLNHNPWLTRFPLTLADVAVGINHGDLPLSTFVYDREEQLLPISHKCKTVWQLLSITGGHPAHIFGEWIEDGLLPIGLWYAERYWLL